MNAKLLMLPLIDIMKLKPSETCFTSKHITDTKKIKDGEKRKRERGAFMKDGQFGACF